MRKPDAQKHHDPGKHQDFVPLLLGPQISALKGSAQNRTKWGIHLTQGIVAGLCVTDGGGDRIEDLVR